MREKAAILWRSVDAVLDAADPLPFLGLHYMQVPSLARSSTLACLALVGANPYRQAA